MEKNNQLDLMCVWQRPNFSNLETERYLIFTLKPASFQTENENWNLSFGPANEEDCQKFMNENRTTYDAQDHMEHLDMMEEDRMQEEEDWYYDQMLDDMEREAFEP
jgi:hypothetical protein